MASRNVKLSTYNCRGIGNGSKRHAVFNWLKHFHKGITLIQETHSVEKYESDWEKEWKGDIYFNHGTSKSCGVATLIPSGLELEVNNIKKDKEGRILILDMILESERIILGNVYFPTKDHPKEQLQMLLNLRAMLGEFKENDCNLVIGGDFNICQDPLVDKVGGINVPKNKVNSE